MTSIHTDASEEEMRKDGLPSAGSEPGHGIASAGPGTRTQAGWSC